LEYNDENIDNDLSGVHFRNGRYDLRDGSFAPRSWGADAPMITRVIDYDYAKYDDIQEKLEIFHSLVMTKIYREPEVLKYVSSVMGRALLGNISSCDLLFFYGSGSNGKTTVCNLLRKTLGPDYCFSIAPSGLDGREANWTASNITKTHRYIFWDEPKADTKKSASFFKAVCNGRIETRAFRTDKTETREIRAKMFITANKIILFASEEDGGLERRFHYYRCKNRYVSSEADVDEANFVYLGSEIGNENYVLSDADKLVIFEYFAYFARMPLMTRSTDYIVTASKLYDLAKLVKYSFVKDGISMVCFDDFYRLIAKVFPFHIHDAKAEKNIIKQLEALGLVYNPQKMAVDVNKQKKKKVLRGVAWRPEGLQMLQAETINFVFSELPDEPAFHFEAPSVDEFLTLNTLEEENRDYWRAVKGDDEDNDSL
jgi:hypothetical protein